ncbi:MAG: hypothetical protein AUG04_04760 [Deltaproteobacteria bacterium 13_1_20CM_2_69_21]|nr:MAG: hypothetical protein AUG04_04760 [Deltaproteobacteria bacterium 13_1_20CM_2_69_21]
MIVFFSSSTSPRASTVILRDRSPRATAVVTSAILRTCVVRFDASVLTLSVRSRQMPLASGTAAWPPSFPSVPTSFATRVTSAPKELSWSTIAFTVVPMRRNSPFTGCPSISSAIFWVRSPSATATSTRATSVVGWTRSAIKALIESTEVFQEPFTSPSDARSVIRPSRLTTRSRRTNSVVSASLRPTTWLKVRAISAIKPVPRVNGSRTANCPSCAATSASSSCRNRASSAPECPLRPIPCPPPSPPRRLRLRSVAVGSCISPTVFSLQKSSDTRSVQSQSIVCRPDAPPRQNSCAAPNCKSA